MCLKVCGSVFWHGIPLTKQIFKLSAFYEKPPPFLLFDCKVFEAARAEGVNFRGAEGFIDQFFPSAELRGSVPPPHLSAQWPAPQVRPSLCIRTMESSTACFCPHEWRRLAAILRGWICERFESSCSDKVRHSRALSARRDD